MHNPSRLAKCTVDLMTKLPYWADDVKSALKSQIIELLTKRTWGRVFEVSYGRTSTNRRALTLRCRSKVKPHCGTRGGVEGIPLPWIFDMLQYFETILPSVKSLWSSIRDEVYFMGGGAAEGLWHHQTWWPFWLSSCILSRIRNQVKTVRVNIFCAQHVK